MCAVSRTARPQPQPPERHGFWSSQQPHTMTLPALPLAAQSAVEPPSQESLGAAVTLTLEFWTHPVVPAAQLPSRPDEEQGNKRDTDYERSHGDHLQALQRMPL